MNINRQRFSYTLSTFNNRPVAQQGVGMLPPTSPALPGRTLLYTFLEIRVGRCCTAALTTRSMETDEHRINLSMEAALFHLLNFPFPLFTS